MNNKGRVFLSFVSLLLLLPLAASCGGGGGGSGGGGVVGGGAATLIELDQILGQPGGDTVEIAYTLFNENSRDVDISLFYSIVTADTLETDNVSTAPEVLSIQTPFLACLPGFGGDGTDDLETSPNGTPHIFVWNAFADGIGIDQQQNIIIRIVIGNNVNEDEEVGETGQFPVFVDTTDNAAPNLTGAVADSIAGVFNDQIVVSFDEAVNPVDARTLENFSFQSPIGTPLSLLGSTIVYNNQDFTTTITLANEQAPINLGTGNDFRVLVSNIRDKNGNTILANSAIDGVVGGDSQGPNLLNALLTDADLSNGASLGDTLDLFFDEAVTANNPGVNFSEADFVLPVTNDTFGFGASIAATGDIQRLRITLGQNPALTALGEYNAGILGAGSPSGIAISVANDLIFDPAGNAASTNDSIDITGNDPVPPMVQNATATAISGAKNDVLAITFDEALNESDAANLANYMLASPIGTDKSLTGASILWDRDTRTTTITLDNNPVASRNLTFGAAFRVTVSNVRDLSGNTITGNGKIFEGVVGGDNEAPQITLVEFTNVNQNGLVDANDTVKVVFNEAINLVTGSFDAADVFLPVNGDTLGTGASVATVTGENALRFTLGQNPLLTVSGLFNNGVLVAGSPTGLGFTAANNLVSDLAGNLPTANQGTDMQNADVVLPTVSNGSATTVSNADNDFFTVVFSKGMLSTDVGNINNFSFESPIGTARSLAGATIAWNANTKTTTITFANTSGADINLLSGATFRATVSAGVHDLSGNTMDMDALIFDGVVGGDVAGPVITAAVYIDQNTSNTVNAGDTLDLLFDEHINLTGSPGANIFSLPCLNDTLGTSPTIQLTADPFTIRVTLGANPGLEIDGIFSQGNLGDGDPSGIGVNGGTNNNIKDLAGNLSNSNAVVDIVESDPLPPQVASSTATAVAGANNDTVTVTFNEPVNPGDAATLTNFSLTVGGQARSLTGAGIAYDQGLMRTTITLGAGVSSPNLSFGSAYTVTVVNVRDLSGNAIVLNNSSNGTVGGDNVAPILQTAVFTNQNNNGLTDAGDTIDLGFNEAISLVTGNFTAADITLTSAGQSLGTNPALTLLNSTTARITLGSGAVINHFGTFNAGNTGANDPTGLGLSGANNAIFDLALNTAAQGNIDVTNVDATQPKVQMATVSSVSGLFGDTIVVKFTEDLVSSDALTLGNYAVESPTGTPISIANANISYSAGTDQTTITLTQGFDFTFNATFKVTVTNVRDLQGNKISPPAVANENVAQGNVAGDNTAPQVSGVLYVDLDTNGVDAGDTLTITFDEDVIYNAGNFNVNGVFLPVTNDSLGGAGLSAELTTARTLVVTLGAGAVLTPDGTFNGGVLNAGSPSGIGFTALNNFLTDPAGNKPTANQAIDMVESDPLPPQVTASVATAVAGLLNDTITVTFNEDMNVVDCNTKANYAFQSPTGTTFSLANATLNYDQGTRVATFTLNVSAGGLPNNLKFGRTFRMTVSNVRDLSGNTISGNNVINGNVTGDNDPPAALMAVFTDNGNGTVGSGDTIDISFDEEMEAVIGSFDATDVQLPVASDTLGTSPTLTQPDNSTVRITLGAGAIITHFGNFNEGSLTAGSPSGIGFSATNNAVLDAAGIAPASGAGNRVDIENVDDTQPTVTAFTATAVTGTLNDVITATFDMDMVSADVTTLGNYALSGNQSGAHSLTSAGISYNSGNRTVTITLNQAGNGDLFFGETATLTISNVRNLLGNPITPPVVVGDNVGQGVVGGDGTAPTLQSVQYLDLDTNGVDQGDALDLTFSESMSFNADAFAANHINLPTGGDTLGTGPSAAQTGATTVRVTLGANPVLTPGGTFGIDGGSSGLAVNTDNNNSFFDVARNEADGTVVDVGSVDNIAPELDTFVLDDVPDILNGRGSAGGTLKVPTFGFTIDLTFSDEGGAGINPAGFVITANKTVAGHVTGTNLFTFITNGADKVITDTTAKITIPSDLAFPTGNCTLTCSVKDNNNNTSNSINFSFTVGTLSNSIRPFEFQQVWFLEFDRDLYDISVSGTTTLSLTHTRIQGGDGTPDFNEELIIFGMNTTAGGGSTIVPNSGGLTVNQAMRQIVINQLIEKVETLYDGVNITFTTTSPGAFPPTTFGQTPYSQSGFSQIAVGGYNSFGVGGLALTDPLNANHDDDTQDENDNIGAILGVFPSGLFEVNMNSGSGTTYNQTFDPFVPGRGTPIGNTGGDENIVSSLFQNFDGAYVGRTAQLQTAVMGFVNAIGRTLAHEMGHSMGLVENGAIPDGLFGGDSTNFPGSTSSHIDLRNTALFPSGSTNVMSPGATYSQSQHAQTRFSPHLVAYLKEIQILNSN